MEESLNDEITEEKKKKEKVRRIGEILSRDDVFVQYVHATEG